MIVYIAGPYRAKNACQVESNIQAARLVAMELARLQIPYICPHLNSAHFDGIAPDSFFLTMGIEQLKLCDAVLLVHGWKKSKGTLAEIKEAESMNIPVFESVDEMMREI